MPLLLALGAGLVGLPVLLHLLMKQEPKRLPFPALRFLQQRQRTNQRKLRLRHYLLLALRMLVIALFCAALFQPKVPAVLDRVGLNLGDGRPVACVVVLDVSPSMGYTVEKRTRLQDAVKRAQELVDRLPSASRVAVVTTADPFAAWELSPGDARRKLDGLTQPTGSTQPLTGVLPQVYALLAGVNAEGGTDGGEAMPRLVAFFSDRAAESWKGDRTDDLKATLDKMSGPAVGHLFFDVGVDKPADVAVLAAEVRPAVVPVEVPVTVSVTLQATGADVPAAEVRCRVVGRPDFERKEVALVAGSPTAVPFTLPKLPAGLYQAEVFLPTPDNLGPDGAPGFDNVRYVTFQVGVNRKVLTVSDDPDDALLWKLAHDSKGDFACDVVRPAEVRDLGGYDVVALLNVRDPAKPLPDGQSLWAKLRPYVERGGKLLVIPGGDEQILLDSYDPTRPDSPAAGLMPGKLERVVDATQLPDADRRLGVAWFLPDDLGLGHPLLAPFKELRLSGRVDFVLTPRKAWKFWDVAASPEAVVARYDDSPDPAKRRPAVLEKVLPGGGKVVLLTTRLDFGADESQKWNDYFELGPNSWKIYFPNLLGRYLAGDLADVSFQFTTGSAVALPLPRGDAGRKALTLSGPNVPADEATTPAPAAGATPTEYRLPPTRTLTAGNYGVRAADSPWQAAFSLNPPAEEANLTKVPAEAIESLCGANAVIPAGKDFDLSAVVEGKGGDFALFPWLLIGVLFLLAAEGLLANRFYRSRGVPGPAQAAGHAAPRAS